MSTWPVETTPLDVLDVRIDRGEWVDAARGGRTVPYKVYRPEPMDQPSYPVIIWSHGLGGTRDGAGFLGRYMAAQGYVHVHIQHDGTDDCLWRGMPGHPWDNIRGKEITWETVRNRYLDVSFALNNLEGMYEGKLDYARLGMCGHSFGALTTQVMAGQLAGRETVEDLSDPRFKSGILYSPIPAFRHQIGGRVVYTSIAMPLLHMTGTNDDSPVESFGYEKRLEVFENAGHGDQHLFLLNDADHMVYNGSRGQLPSYPDIEKHQAMIAQISYAWWEATLNNNRAAYEWLYGQDVIDYVGNAGIYKRR
jgi:dienelactone hydrolase